MGGQVAKSIRPVPASFGVFSLRLHQKMYALSTLHANESVLQAIRTMAQQYFSGYTEQQLHPTALVFKLPAKVKQKGGLYENELLYEFLCDLLIVLSSLGYFLACSPDLFLSLEEDELIFCKDYDRKPTRAVFCVRLVGDDGVQLSHADGYVSKLVTQVLDKHQAKADPKVAGKFIVPGCPWKQSAIISGTSVLVDLVAKLGAAGYALTGNACINGEQDTLFFGMVEKPMKAPEFMLLCPEKSSSLIGYCMPEEVYKSLTQIFKRDWPQGLKSEKKHSSIAVEIEANGDLWLASTDKEQITKTQRFFMIIVEGMAANGWKLLASIDWSASLDDKSAFLFTRTVPCRIHLMAVQPIGRNRLAVSNAPKDLAIMTDTVFMKLLGAEAVKQKMKLNDGTILYELAGTPWFPDDSEDTLVARHAISVLVGALLAREWMVVCAADIQGDMRTVTTKNLVSSTSTTTGAAGASNNHRMAIGKAKGKAQKREQKVYQSKAKNDQFDVSTIIFAKQL